MQAIRLGVVALWLVVGCGGDDTSDPECGNGTLEPGETCDDGNTTNGDGCNSLCLPAACGNAILDPNEVCDDGNTVDADGCSASCMSNETCGNTLLDVVIGETCDDGNTLGGDGCSATCTTE